MRVLYRLGGLLVSVLLGLGRPANCTAQAGPDSVGVRAPAWLLKSGLSLTRLSYDRTATTWQLLVPLTMGIEYRPGIRYSLYSQFEADCEFRRTARRRRGAGSAATLPALVIGLGSRFYYGRPAGQARPLATAPEWGKYVALEAEAALTSPAVRSRAYGGTAVLTPSLYALWGIQNRLRPHLLYDLSAGLGLVAPATTRRDYPLVGHRWDVGAQVNIRVYWVN